MAALTQKVSFPSFRTLVFGSLRIRACSVVIDAAAHQPCRDYRRVPDSLITVLFRAIVGSHQYWYAVMCRFEPVSTDFAAELVQWVTCSTTVLMRLSARIHSLEGVSGLTIDNYTRSRHGLPQEPLNNQLIAYPHGYGHGGSNSAKYTHGSSDDYDRFAELAGDDGWNWDNLFPYAIQNEKHVPPNDGCNETGQRIHSIHGTDEPLSTSIYGYATDFDDRVITTTSELSEEFPWNPAYNSGNMLGVSWMNSELSIRHKINGMIDASLRTISGPLRSSSATASLLRSGSQQINRLYMSLLWFRKRTQACHLSTTGFGEWHLLAHCLHRIEFFILKPIRLLWAVGK
ncbi:uncharacterized protein ARMOST_15263 [Armillaria ostoyae]|uniref:Uncharacterized protein n=1 Tax=Armillaria ostoyae TaxID=47428 RepID=A0A284RSX0_ARMOS|nr:uncharacterized protein ARMOST_15263 [Armillaria ostoyae]